MTYAIGLDYGTNSVRCLIVETLYGQELITFVYKYETGHMDAVKLTEMVRQSTLSILLNVVEVIHQIGFWPRAEKSHQGQWNEDIE